MASAGFPGHKCCVWLEGGGVAGDGGAAEGQSRLGGRSMGLVSPSPPPAMDSICALLCMLNTPRREGVYSTLWGYGLKKSIPEAVPCWEVELFKCLSLSL